jgi:hypothetical protein
LLVNKNALGWMLFTVKELVWTVAGSMGQLTSIMKSVGWKSIVLPQPKLVLSTEQGVDVGVGVGVGVAVVQTSVIGW